MPGRKEEVESLKSFSGYSRGSVWRRWDLHVHTPYSVLNNGFGDDFDVYAAEVFNRAIKDGIAVIGVTDYFSIDGYKELSEIQGDDQRLEAMLGADRVGPAKEILLLPNIELRLSEFVTVGTDDSRLNMHVLFSDRVPIREIEENFLQRLQFVSHSAPDSPDEMKNLTKANLEDLGAEVKRGHERFRGESDLKVGVTQVSVAHTEITKCLEPRAFRGRHLVVLASDEDLSGVSWDGQGHHTRKLLVQKSHMLWSSNPKTRSFALGEHEDTVEEFEAQFNRRKACVHGSDAHEFEKLFVFDLDRKLWVRADPTFDGLAQLLVEPEDRVYIGGEPPALARVRSAAARTIDSVVFERSDEAGPDDKWFSGEVELNPGLVVIIGKKGSGKSALADAIGLAGGAHTQRHFSFLTPRRFLDPKDNLGRFFDVELRWLAGDPERARLDERVDPSLPERVKYLPQSYLETICGDLDGSEGRRAFDAELEAVIFSHIPAADRLSRSSLHELLAHKTAETEEQIRHLRIKLGELNREFLSLRRRNSEVSRKALAEQLAQRQADLEAHRKAKPVEVPDPAKQAKSTANPTKPEEDLAAVVAEIESLDEQRVKAQAKDQEAKKKKAALDRMLKRIETFEERVSEFFEQSREDAIVLEIDTASLLSVDIQTGALMALGKEVDQEIEELALALDPDRTGSIIHRRKAKSEQADKLRLALDEPQRRFQEYRRKLSGWETQEKEILGSPQDPKSVKGLEAIQEGLTQIPAQAAEKIDQRETLVRQIFSAKLEVIAAYESLHRPVQEHIDRHDLALEDNSLSFSAAINVVGLEDRLLAMINQRRRGSFAGEHEGRERLVALIKASDFSSVDGVLAFLRALGKHLENDMRGEKPSPVNLDEQLVQDASAEELYDFVFGLEYLRPRFELRWRGRTVDQLSPGERGTLLLVFYLLVDDQQIPLVIDQPEENLDNETVAELLVPAVKHAKDHRQIVLVTHNPNLAVVCDADQVVHVSIDKRDGNCVTYTSGSIENPEIAQLIVNVLEGTKPAFDLRDAKYDVLDRGAA